MSLSVSVFSSIYSIYSVVNIEKRLNFPAPPTSKFLTISIQTIKFSMNLSLRRYLHQEEEEEKEEEKEERS